MTMDNGPHWFVACVRSCQEKKVAESLRARFVEHYLPVRRELRQWSDRRKLVEALLVPRFIFIRCRDSERAAILAEEPRIWRFLSYEGNAAVVRDVEMEAFRNMVEKGEREVRFSEQPPVPGDKVRVVSGPLSGLECELTEVSGRRCLAVRLGMMGAATMDLDLETIEKI